ncbi:MAG: hypothetical protein IJJ99_10265 [Oscillospiraceae bacterium]|nr:hypothetical protein [Oscillospiraceae bacterium]
MKKRIIALLLLLALALTACTSAPKDTEDDKRVSEATDASETEVTETTEESPEATATTEATEETLPGQTDVDLGAIDGNAYRNETLGISCSFPEDWYIYNETDLASLNKLVESGFAHEAIADIIEREETLIIFCASDPATMTSVQIAASKNTLPDAAADEAAIVRYFSPIVMQQAAESGMQPVTGGGAEADFCGQTHAVLMVSGETMGVSLYETLLYLPRGGLIYALSVTTTQESMIEECLGMFEAIQ